MKKILYFLPLALAVSCGNPESKSNESNEETTEKIEVSEPKIVGKEVTYEGDSIIMKGYLAYDENLEGPRPGVIIVHEWWGHNEHTRNSAEKLAKTGYVAFALDMYGEGAICNPFLL